jgi:hypothetical protein
MNAMLAPFQEFHAPRLTGTSFPLFRQWTLADLKCGEPVKHARAVNVDDEEMIDERDAFRPSEFVQRKLQLALKATLLPVSCMHTERLVRRPA